MLTLKQMKKADRREFDKWRLRRFEGRYGKHIPPSPTKLKCKYCGSEEGVCLESARTAYHWDGKGEDPNAPVPLCRPCAKEHHDHWDDMWSNVP